MRLCRRPTGSPVAMSIASCESCASSPWLPSPCAVRLRRPTRVLGASRNERCRLLRGSGKSYQLWCVRRTWTEMPLHTPCRAKKLQSQEASTQFSCRGRRTRDARKHALRSHRGTSRKLQPPRSGDRLPGPRRADSRRRTGPVSGPRRSAQALNPWTCEFGGPSFLGADCLRGAPHERTRALSSGLGLGGIAWTIYLIGFLTLCTG